MLLPDSDILDNFPIKISTSSLSENNGSLLRDAHLLLSGRGRFKSSAIMSGALVCFYQILRLPFELLKDVELHHCMMEP